MVFIDYPKKGITFLVGLGSTLLGFNIYVMKPKRFLIYPKKSILDPLNNCGHKQYPSNSLE